MAETTSFYTVTMAKVYEDQGNDNEALRILHHLLSADPERDDLKEAIDRVKTRVALTTEKLLARLLEEWVDLLLAHHRIQRLKNMNDQSRKIAKGDQWE